MANNIKRFNRTGLTQNRPHHGRPKKLSARAQHHIQSLCLGNRRMSAANISAEVEGVGGQPVNVKSSHLYLYSAFNNTNFVKATAKYQNRKILYN